MMNMAVLKQQNRNDYKNSMYSDLASGKLNFGEIVSSKLPAGKKIAA